VITTLFVACSLDGFIAGPEDDLSWLFTDSDYGFTDFFEEVDTLIMGRGTYDVVRSFGKWPYPDKANVVVTRRQDLEVDTPGTTVWNGDLRELMASLLEDGAESVWLVGGGELVKSMLDLGLVQRITVSLHPILIGGGIRLFPKGFPTTHLELEEAIRYDNGLMQLVYQVAATAHV